MNFKGKPAKFSVIGQITNRRTIAIGAGIHIIEHLETTYGAGRWRKMSGDATIELLDGTQRLAEIHWYEAHGIGKFDLKRKHYLDEL